MAAVLSRISPAPAVSIRRASRLVARHMMIYRKTWPEFIAGFFEPLCYLLLVGIGLGPIIGQIAGPGGGEVSYISFAAPAMLAASAMNGAIYDSTFSVLFQLLRYGKVFVAVQATPLTSSDIVLGQIIWAQLRAVIYSTAFFAIMLAIGTVHSVWAVLVLPAASLAAFAFGAIGLASAAYMRSWQDLEFVTIGMLASYLFSATFFPLSVYPHPVQVLVQLTPLYHASDLLRGLTLGVVTPGLLIDALYLATVAGAAFVIATRRVPRLLAP